MVSKLPFARCDECPLRDGIPVPGYGPRDASLIVIGDAPSMSDETDGKPFAGQSGALLDAALQQAGEVYGLEGVYRTNVVACRSLSGREPGAAEVSCCRPRLLGELNQLPGKKVVAMGNVTHEFFGVPSNERGAIYTWRDKNIMPVWHPAYVMRMPKEASEFLALIRRGVQGPFEHNFLKWPEVRWINSLAHLQEALAECPDDAWVAFDIETDQVQWYDTPAKSKDPILMLQLAWSEDFALILSDAMLYDTDGVVACLQDFFNRVQTTAHNGKFDCVFLQSHLGLHIHQDFDTMLAHYVLDENLLHGLKYVSRIEFGIPNYEEETIAKYLKSNSDNYSKIPEDELAKYGAMDVVATLKLRELLAERLRTDGMYEWPFQNILMEAANKLTEVELRGMQVDQHQLDQASADLLVVLDKLKDQIREMVGVPDLNPNSTQQLAEVLYDRMRLPQVKGRKVKPRSTAHEVLEKLRNAHPVIPVILNQRRVQKIRSSYVENLRGYLDLNGRVHANFKIQGTEVSRLAVADPALQTIPRPSDYYGALIRSSFIAREGHVILVCDFSQAELRIYACLSMDPFLLKVYKEDRDLHSEVAIGMYGTSYTKEQRVQCKMFNFSYVYGGNEYSFAQDSGLNIEVAKKFVSDYNALMPVGLAWKKNQLHLARTQGYVETRFGRRRRFPLITQETVDEARKACVHMPCASSASDLTLMSANYLVSQHVPVVLTVHDSVLVECLRQDQDEIGQMMVSTMQTMGDKHFPEVPWKVDLEARERWAEPLPLP